MMDSFDCNQQFTNIDLADPPPKIASPCPTRFACSDINYSPKFYSSSSSKLHLQQPQSPPPPPPPPQPPCLNLEDKPAFENPTSPEQKEECSLAAIVVDKALGLHKVEDDKGGIFRDLTVYVILICLFSSLGGFLFGYDTGTISGAKGFASFIEFFQDPSTAMVSFVVSAVIIGALVGSAIGGPLADKFGRKKMLIVCGVVYTAGAALMGGARAIGMLVAARFIVGVSVGIGSLIVPLYAAEMAPPRFRGALISFNQLFITLGILVANGVNLGFQSVRFGWAYSLGIGGAPAVVLLFGMMLLPETPYYYVSKNKDEQARNVLEDIRGTKKVDKELMAMKQSISLKQANSQSKWTDLVKPELLKLLMVGFGVSVLQQFVGINVIMYYAPNLFNTIGYTEAGELFTTFIVGLVNVVVTVAGLLLVDRVGRKTLLLFGSATMAISMLVVSILVGVNLFETNRSLGFITVIAVCVFVMGYAVSWGVIAWVIPSEIYPSNMRGKMMAISTFGSWMANFVATISFLPLYTTIGWGIFLVITIIDIISFVFVWFFVPETRGRAI